MSRRNKKQRITLWIALAVAIILALSAFVFLRGNCYLCYKAERIRFDKVLTKASDEELIIVLKYAITQHYVPTIDVDPYYDVCFGVGCWHRSLLVYDKLKEREDLLQQIYPDLDVLHDYIRARNAYVMPVPDTIAIQTILHNAQKDNGLDVDSLMNAGTPHSSLAYKYFGTPLLRY